MDVCIFETFPTQAVGDHVLSNYVRKAFFEVDICLERSVEVMSWIQTKALQVVGSYHPHQDASFKVQP